MTDAASGSPPRFPLTAAVMRSSLPAVALAIALAACGDAAPLAPLAPEAPLAPVAPDVAAALADAEARLVPALDAELRAPAGATLAALRAALDAGSPRDGARALAALRALLDGHAAGGAVGSAESDPDAADLAAIGVLADLAARALAGEAPGS